MKSTKFLYHVSMIKYIHALLRDTFLRENEPQKPKNPKS